MLLRWKKLTPRQHWPSGQEVHYRTQPDKGYGERRGFPQHETGGPRSLAAGWSAARELIVTALWGFILWDVLLKKREAARGLWRVG